MHSPDLSKSNQALSKRNQVMIQASQAGYYADPTGTVWTPRGQRLKGSFNRRGYQRITTSMGVVFVHKLVAFQKYGEVMLGEGIQVRHLDGNSKNNTWRNIAIGTGKENSADKSPETRARAASMGNRKYDELVPEWQRLRAEGWSYKRIAKEYVCSISTVHYHLGSGKRQVQFNAEGKPVSRKTGNSNRGGVQHEVGATTNTSAAPPLERQGVSSRGGALLLNGKEASQ